MWLFASLLLLLLYHHLKHANQNHEHMHNYFQNGIDPYDNSSKFFYHFSLVNVYPIQPEFFWFFFINKIPSLRIWTDISISHTIFTCFSKLAIWSISAFLYGLLNTWPVLLFPIVKIDEALGRTAFFVSLLKNIEFIDFGIIKI